MFGPSAPGSQRAVGLTQVAQAAVEPWVTEAGSVEAVAAALVVTVTLLVAIFAIETLGAAWGKVGPRECPLGMAPMPKETFWGLQCPAREPAVAWAIGAWPEGLGPPSSLMTQHPTQARSQGMGEGTTRSGQQ